VFDFGTTDLENATIFLTFSLTHAKSSIYDVSMPRIRYSKGVLHRQACRTPYLIFKTMLASKQQKPKRAKRKDASVFACFFYFGELKL
jgi:hypothetical protein